MPRRGERLAVAERADSFAENPNDISAEEAKAVTVVEELAAVQNGDVRPTARSREFGESLSVQPSKLVPRESSTDKVLLFCSTMPQQLQPRLSPINGSAASAEVVMMDSIPKLLHEGSGNQQRVSFSGTARQHLGSWKLKRQIRGATAAGVNESAQALGELQAATETAASAASAGSSAAAEIAR